jgi:hypothetical protein
MFRVDAGKTSRYCDGLNRRSFLQFGVSGMASLGLGDVLRAKAAGQGGKDTSVILIWLDGGPSHIDLYDMKPEAPVEYRGYWKPIPTNVPGIDISELFPKQAQVAGKFSIVRSLYHDSGDHYTGGHIMLTGRAGRVSANKVTGEYPSMGSIVARLHGRNRPGMPAYVALPFAKSIGIRPGYFGANYLGSAYNPFEVSANPSQPEVDGHNPTFGIPNLDMPEGVTIQQLDDRMKLRARFDTLRRDIDRSGTFDTMDQFEREAFELVTGPTARKAFDLSTEDPRLRDRYGRNTLDSDWGQLILLARRLAEAGSTFVTVHLGGWDHHLGLKVGMESFLPRLDAALSSLFADLDDRGQWERTLVVVCGEFGRTPRMNNNIHGDANPGRDHWGNAMFCQMGGGGVKGGRIVGSTDRLGAAPQDCAVTPPDIHATIYHVLGIDPSTPLLDHSGRPVAAADRTKPIAQLL